MFRELLKKIVPVPINLFNCNMNKIILEVKNVTKELNNILAEQNRKIDEQNRKIDEQNRKIDEQNKRIREYESGILSKVEGVEKVIDLLLERELETKKLFNTNRSTIINGFSGIHSKLWELKQESKVMHYELLEPSQYREQLCKWYNNETGEILDLDNPITFNEKIQWLKLYDNSELKTRLADKYCVREWVKEKIGDKYLIPLLGVWNKFDDIDFSNLPKQFALKTNHSSGWNIIVDDKNKLNLSEAKRKIDRWMQINFAFVSGFELQYKDIKRKIIAEQYIDPTKLFTYNIFCFNGEPYSIWVDSPKVNKEHRRNIYDINWNLQLLKSRVPNFEENIEKPKCLEEMIKLARILSKPFLHVRVDLYNIEGKVYFSEMTFTSASGRVLFDPPEYNKIYGDMLKLPRPNM